MSDIFRHTQLVKMIEIVHTLKIPKIMEKARLNPIEFFAQYGIVLSPNVEYEIYLNNDQYYYFMIPVEGNSELTHDIVNQLYAGRTNKYGCASCVGSLSTISSYPSSSGSVTSLTSFSSATSDNYKPNP